MILSNEAIMKQIGEVQTIDVNSNDLGIAPGANIWAFAKGEVIPIKRANYKEVVAYMDNDTNRRIMTPTEEQKGKARKTTFKFIALEDGRLLSLATLLRKFEGKFHRNSVNLPEAITISEILAKIDGKNLEVLTVDSFKVKARNTDGSIKKDAEGKEVERDQKWYAFELK